MYAVTSGVMELAPGAIILLNNNVEQARKWMIESRVHMYCNSPMMHAAGEASCGCS